MMHTSVFYFKTWISPSSWMFFHSKHVAQVRWKFYKGRVVWYCVVFDWPRPDHVANTTVYCIKAGTFDVSKINQLFVVRPWYSKMSKSRKASSERCMKRSPGSANMTGATRRSSVIQSSFIMVMLVLRFLESSYWFYSCCKEQLVYLYPVFCLFMRPFQHAHFPLVSHGVLSIVKPTGA